MVVDKNGDLFITRHIEPDHVYKYDSNLSLLLGFGTYCSISGTGCEDPDENGPLKYGDGQFEILSGIDVDKEGNILIYDPAHGKIHKFDSSGKILKSFILPEFEEPSVYNMGMYFGIEFDLAVNDQNQFYVLDGFNKHLYKLDSDGTPLKSFNLDGESIGMNMPVSIDIYEQTGDIFVLDKKHDSVFVFDSSENYKFRFGSSGKDTGSLLSPTDIKIDNLRNNIIIADTINNRIVFYPIVDDNSK